MAPLLTRDRGRGCSDPSQHRGRGGIVSKTVVTMSLQYSDWRQTVMELC